MLRRLLFVADLVLVIGASVLGMQLYRTWTAVPQEPRLSIPAPPPTASRPPPAPPAARQAAFALSAFAGVVERSLFKPPRTDSVIEQVKTPPITAAPTPAPPKPWLDGVVLGTDGGGRAYLEDPRTQKVLGYALGDTVAESRVEQIQADRVVLRRGAEVFEVLLRDPSKPRPGVPSPPSARPNVPARAIAWAGLTPQTPETAPGLPPTGIETWPQLERLGLPAFSQTPGSTPGLPLSAFTGETLGAVPDPYPRAPGGQPWPELERLGLPAFSQTPGSTPGLTTPR